jgi:tetratricopeptide (TPR) repeat protein
MTGLVLLRRRLRELELLYTFVAAYMAGLVAFFVVARFRLPAVPVLIVFASWTAVQLVGFARARQWGAFASGAGLFAAMFLVANAGYPGFLSERGAHVAISHYTLAGALAERGDEDGALVELARARISYERSPSPHYQGIAQDIYYKLGAVLYVRGRCKEAADALGHVLPGDPRATDARMMFADCCEKLGRPNEAGVAYQMVLRVQPDNRSALEGLIRCFEATGQYEKAAEARKHLPATEAPPAR